MQCTTRTVNLSTITFDPVVKYADLLLSFHYYIYFGAAAVLTNAVCVTVFVSKKKLLEKHALFVALAVGDLLNGLGLLLAGVIRTRMIMNYDTGSRSRWQCLGSPWPHLYIFGGQLSALVLLTMGIERVFAVFKPLYYKTTMTPRLRMVMVAGCAMTTALSLIVGYFFTFLDRNTCTQATCTIPNTTGYIYSSFNYAIVILLPIISLFFGIIAYIGAKRLSVNHSPLHNELKKLFAILIITTGSVALTAIPSAFMVGYGSWWTLPGNVVAYLNIGFCGNSIVNLIVYFVFKPNFRRQLFVICSCGALSHYLEKKPGPEQKQTHKISPIVNMLFKERSRSQSAQI